MRQIPGCSAVFSPATPALTMRYIPIREYSFVWNVRQLWKTGTYRASERYNEFIRRHKNMHVMFLELGVGFNTPGIIKYPFWKMTAENPNAVYACVNLGEAFCPDEISERSLCIDGDIAELLKML